MATTVNDDYDLQALLDDMGNTSAEVADYLISAGVTGKPDSAVSCPIANWLLRETGAVEVEVAGQHIELTFDRIATDEVWSFVTCEPPGSVDDFIYRFDNGDYPDLMDAEVSNP